MKYIEALHDHIQAKDECSLFLAGGITGCPDWQQEAVQLFQSTEITLFNPRRKDFPINDPHAATEQIKWEHCYLRKADAILFWFPCETLCPIVLYELGAWSMTSKPIFVGRDLDYQRKKDVEIQTKLTRPEVEVVGSLDALVAQVKKVLEFSKSIMTTADLPDPDWNNMGRWERGNEN